MIRARWRGACNSLAGLVDVEVGGQAGKGTLAAARGLAGGAVGDAALLPLPYLFLAAGIS